MMHGLAGRDATGLALCVVVASGSGKTPVATIPLPSSEPAPAATATALPATALDPTRLPLGDGKISTAAQRGSVYACQTRFAGGGAFRDGPWIKSDGTWDSTAKVVVDGEVSWPSRFTMREEGDRRIVETADLPDHATGVYPIGREDDAFQYDRNPNSIVAQTFRFDLPLQPAAASQPSCVPMGPIGVLLNGVVFFNALDAQGKDAVAHEIQDRCNGHPERSGAYHYHNITPCLSFGGTGHSPMVGYAFDGFGIYGSKGEDGRVLTDADLDECHGHTHEVEWNGQRVTIYHYHATLESPYTVGCFHGTSTVRPGPP
jgi:hypothetical protein